MYTLESSEMIVYSLYVVIPNVGQALCEIQASSPHLLVSHPFQIRPEKPIQTPE